MNNGTSAVYSTIIGDMLVREDGGYILEIRLIRDSESYDNIPSKLTDSAIGQILEYLNGERRIFDIPISSAGTQFQKSVWTAISEIPYGETVTYSELARRVGRPSAVRAVANACGANPVMIVVPCHRIVGKNNIGGYEFGTAVKEKLIELEKDAK